MPANSNGTSAKPQSVFDRVPVKLPQAPIAEDIDHEAVATSFAANLASLEQSHFLDDAVWRDSFALTGTLRTFYTSKSVSQAWKETCAIRSAVDFSSKAVSSHLVNIPSAGTAWIEATYTFNVAAVPACSCLLIALLVPGEAGEWKIWCLASILDDLIGQRSVHTCLPDSPSSINQGSGSYDCVIIGAGQAGLCAAGRMHALGINYLLLEAQSNIGDSWNTRYDSARLHTIREYSHLPFERTFGEEYQEWLTKEDLARGFQHWVRKFNIKAWTSTEVTSGHWNEDRQIYTLQVYRNGQRQELQCSNVIISVGTARIPIFPNLSDRDRYKGKLLHSVEYKSAATLPRGKGIVIGSANTAHDVAVEMVDEGLDVTMVQRSPTFVIPVEHYQAAAVRSFNAQIATHLADRERLSLPFAIVRLLIDHEVHARIKAEPERFDALEAKGFKVDRYANMTHILYERGGGHYMDIGACKRIVAGEIKMKSDSVAVAYTENGLLFADGSKLEADSIVLATGFEGNIRDRVRTMFGDHVAERVEDYWGFDEECEIRGSSKPMRQPGLWLFGGDFGYVRWMSSFVAIQVKARLLGTPLPVYDKKL